MRMLPQSLKDQTSHTVHGWTTLPHPLYSPNLAHSDFCPFGLMYSEDSSSPMMMSERSNSYMAKKRVKNLLYKVGIHT